MPVSLSERLPLPTLRVYAALSVALVAAAAYHAAGVTSDPAWRANSSLQRREAAASAAPAAVLEPLNTTKNFTEQAVDVITFIIQEPLCMWTVINLCYCVLALVASGIRSAVFGRLRVAEAQRVKDKLWNYVFYKFIFVFGVVNVQYMDEVLLWCSWFTLVGFLNLLAHLCKDRFEYVCVWGEGAGVDGGGGGGGGVEGGGGRSGRLAALAGALVAAAAALLLVAARALPHDPHTFAFMAAEAVLVVVLGAHVVARALLARSRAEPAAPPAYYTHLAFDSLGLGVELAHVSHMVWYSRLLLSVPALVLLLQLRQLLHRLQLRLRRHTRYRALHRHMSRHYPMASKEEVEKNQDNCAICWEPMREARKLPCAHLFHNSCLCQWVQQDASCPTCRRALRAAAPAAAAAPDEQPPRAAPAAPLAAPPLPPFPPLAPDHLFRFDGSRYASWLPSFSVEVRRSRGTDPAPPPAPAAPAAPPLSPAAPLAAQPRDSPPPEPVIYTGSTEEAGTSAEATTFAGSFSVCAAEREAALRRRQRELLAAARARYLHKHAAPAAPSAAASRPAPAPPRS